VENKVNDGEIQRVIEQLDASVPKEGSKVLIHYDGETPYCELVGNRNGYLRAAIEFLRAATIDLESGGFITPVDFNYLVPGERGLLVKRLERRDDVLAALPAKREKTWKDKVTEKAFAVGCLSILLFLAICALIGIAEVGNWIFAK
jgi:hypothetical protein